MYKTGNIHFKTCNQILKIFLFQIKFFNYYLFIGNICFCFKNHRNLSTG